MVLVRWFSSSWWDEVDKALRVCLHPLLEDDGDPLLRSQDSSSTAEGTMELVIDSALV